MCKFIQFTTCSFIMYDDGFGNIYHPKCNGVTCRDIPRDLEYNNRKLVHHNHQGRRIKKKSGKLVLFRGVEINGVSIKKPRIGSPLRKKEPRKMTAPEDPGTIHDECLPSFPAWKGQVESLAQKLKDGGLETTLNEIQTSWKDWTKQAAIAYLSGQDSRSVSAISKTDLNSFRKIVHMGTAPWKHSISSNTEKISDQLRLNTKIISMFFKKYRERCLIDCSFMLSENGRSVAELEKQLRDFVTHVKRILSFEWPMAVANLMLDEGASWIPLLVTATSHTVFNAVAATMSRLLYDVVNENINRVKTFFDEDDRARLIIFLQEGDEVFDYWQKINVLLELCKS